MDGSKDSMQLGIAAYNKEDYQTAERFFQDVYSRNPQHNDALRYLGQTHLVTGNYDAAILAFDELAKKKSYSNPGLFLKAVTLMKRNAGNDKQVAKGLLQKIAQESLDGSKEAKLWLEKWPGE
jgi:TolA-binding protein